MLHVCRFFCFLKKDLLFVFVGWRGGGSQIWSFFCGRDKCMTPKWFKITTDSVNRGNSFNIKPQARQFWLCREQPPAALPPTHPSPRSTDDQTKARVTFSWQLIVYMKKYFGVLNIAFWLASNKTLWTRKCNSCS